MSEGAEDSSEKSHAPTQRRLEQAREKGDIPQSADVTTAAVYAGFTLTALGFGSGALLAFGATLAPLLDQADSLSATLFAGTAAPVLAPWAGRMIINAAPWFLIPGAFAILALLAQGGPVFAGSKLAPKLSRIGPISNAGQKFGLNGVVEFLKALAKLSVMGVLLGLYLSDNMDEIIATVALEPGPGLAALATLLIGLLMRVVVVAAGFAIIDAIWQRQSFNRRNMMSRKDILDEMKESEGDPMLKQQRRARGVAIATAPLRQAVAEASVIVVNPTHFAVALAWDRDSPGAPRCVAKGVDAMAARIREIAAEKGIPIHSDPPTARALFAEVKVGQEIDRRHFRAVAAAIRFAERIRERSAR